MRTVPATLIIFGLLALADAKSLVDYRIPLCAKVEAPKDCTSPGLFCETCADLVACIETDSSTWTKTAVQTCPSGQKCLRGGCTAQYDPFCDGTADLDFPCKQSGIFPDPFYCNKYVLCAYTNGALKAYPNKCEEGLGYNVEKGLCDVVLEEGACKDGDYPLPLCEAVGQSEALEGKPQQYYTCEQYSDKKEVLYPVIDVCPHAEVYKNFVCEK